MIAPSPTLFSVRLPASIKIPVRLACIIPGSPNPLSLLENGPPISSAETTRAVSNDDTAGSSAKRGSGTLLLRIDGSVFQAEHTLIRSIAYPTGGRKKRGDKDDVRSRVHRRDGVVERGVSLSTGDTSRPGVAAAFVERDGEEADRWGKEAVRGGGGGGRGRGNIEDRISPASADFTTAAVAGVGVGADAVSTSAANAVHAACGSNGNSSNGSGRKIVVAGGDRRKKTLPSEIVASPTPPPPPPTPPRLPPVTGTDGTTKKKRKLSAAASNGDGTAGAVAAGAAVAGDGRRGQGDLNGRGGGRGSTGRRGACGEGREKRVRVCDGGVYGVASNGDADETNAAAAAGGGVDARQGRGLENGEGGFWGSAGGGVGIPFCGLFFPGAFLKFWVRRETNAGRSKRKELLVVLVYQAVVVGLQ